MKKGDSGTSKHEPARKYYLHPARKVARELKEVLSPGGTQVGQTEPRESEIWTRTCWRVSLEAPLREGAAPGLNEAYSSF